MKKILISVIAILSLITVSLGANFADTQLETVNQNVASDIDENVAVDHIDENGAIHFAPMYIFGDPNADLSKYDEFAEYENAENVTVIEFTEDEVETITLSLNTPGTDTEQYRFADLRLDD